MMRANYLASLDIFGHLINRGVAPERIMGGRCLFLGGSTDLEYNEHGIATGDLSGLVTPLIRWPLSAIYSPGPEVALMSHWPEKIEAMARIALEQDIRFVSGMPSWALVLVERVLEMARRRGVDARCARDVWPNIEVFVHGGVRYDPFTARMNGAFFGDPAVDFPARHELYPASEGFIAMQDRSGDPSMRLLADNGIFFEFVERERFGDDAPEARACWEVETGTQYVVVLSTNAGLWRYAIGDVVEFDSVPDGPRGGGDGPARLRIVGRHTHFINAFGENLIGEHIEDGVAAASRETGIAVGEFTAAPVYPGETGRAGLELAVEMHGARRGARRSIVSGTPSIAPCARSMSITTRSARTRSGWARPTITALAPGAFHDWMAREGKLGGQHKCPRCANDRGIIERVTDADRDAPRAG